jgi:hypothetical protein
MKEKEIGRENLIRLCQAVSPNHEPCEYLATAHCRRCNRWFCEATLRMRSGIHVRCRQEKKAANRRLRLNMMLLC